MSCRINIEERHLSGAWGALRFGLAEYITGLKTNPQAGFSIAWLETIFVGVVLLIVLVTFLLQQGLPQLLSASSNTTALVAAGADATTISWVGFISKIVVVFMLIGVLIIGIRVAMGGVGGGGGGGHRRRGRR